jgi:hypothetical protein
MNDGMRIEMERYLDGGMNPGEAEAFLEAVRKDPEALACLGRALEQQALLYDGIRARGGEEGGRVPLRPRHRSRGWRTVSSGPAFPWFVGIAAAAALTAVGMVLVLQKPPVPPHREAVQKPPVPVVPQRPEVPPPPDERAPAGTPGKAPEKVSRPPVRDPVESPGPAPMPEPPEAAPERPVPPVPPQPPAERVPGMTFTAVARVEKVEGTVSLPDGTGLRANHVVLEGQGFRTGPASAAVLRFPDGTRIEAGGETLVREIRLEGGRRINLDQGSLTAEVVRQAPGTSTVFVTPHGEATIVGTVLRLAVDAGKTRLDVSEGKVRLRRLPDGKPVEVAAGQYAVAAPGVNPAPRPLPIDEILILPHQATLSGTEWRLIRDPASTCGLALENLKTSNRYPDGVNADASRITFAFKADADKTYIVWVRGCTLGPKDVMSRDAVFLDWPEGQVVETPGPSKGKGGLPTRALFNGFMHRAGYWWLGGDADGEADAAAPVTVRFARPGRQILKVFAYEPPVRIEAIWLSATQKARPADAHPGPR